MIRKKGVLFCWVMGLIAIDLTSKWWIVQKFFDQRNPPYPCFRHFLGGIDFSIGYVKNTGAAFGMLAEFPDALLAFRLLFILGVFLAFFVWNRWTQFSFEIVLILSGAMANCFEMVVHHAVTDFLQFSFYGWTFPLFNIADTCITIGAALLLLKEGWIGRKKQIAT